MVEMGCGGVWLLGKREWLLFKEEEEGCENEERLENSPPRFYE